MRGPTGRSLALAGTLLLATAAVAQEAPEPKGDRTPPRVRVHVGGGLTVGSLSFSETRTFEEFAEDASLEARYESDSAPGFDAGLEFRFGKRFGAQLAVSRYTRSGDVDFTLSVPHPFFFGLPRSVSGTLGSLSYSETAGHLDFVVLATQGDVELEFFAGPSLLQVEADLLLRADFGQGYPFDEISLAATPTVTAKDSPLGFNAGASLDVRLSERFGLGALVRYTGAKATLNAVPESAIDVNVGGFAATLGLRLIF